MLHTKDIHNIIGVIGNVISFGLFLSPCATFYRIIKKKDVEEFQFYPYIATVLNCMLWIFYGLPLVSKDSLLVTTINSVGLVIELIYLAIFVVYDRQNRGRKQVFLGLVMEVIFMVAIILITLLVFPKGDHSYLKHRGLLVGILCDILNICMYGSPLLIWRKVFKTKSVEYMPFLLSLTNFLNGGCWLTYGLIEFDIFIVVSNGLGFLLGSIQLVIYACYYKSTPKKSIDDNLKPTTGVQLSGATAA